MMQTKKLPTAMTGTYLVTTTAYYHPPMKLTSTIIVAVVHSNLPEDWLSTGPGSLVSRDDTGGAKSLKILKFHST
jgi:hypothetical protein